MLGHQAALLLASKTQVGKLPQSKTTNKEVRRSTVMYEEGMTVEHWGGGTGTSKRGACNRISGNT